MQIGRIAVLIACLSFAAMALGRGVVLWHRDRRLPKNLTRAPYFSRAVHYGVERAMLPMAASGVFGAAAVFISPWSGGSSQLSGARWWLGVIAASGITVSMGVTFAIIYFNRPRWIVPPFMRSEQGITAAWWSRRRLHGGQGAGGSVKG
jgi:hypothetical protein